MPTSASRLDEARAYVEAGLSLVPIGEKSKCPPIAWKEYQERKPTDDELVEWTNRYPGLGIVCGKVSGNLEVLDLEAIAPIQEFHALVENAAPGLLSRLPRIKTPTGGRHIPYRCKTISGSAKLAMRNAGSGPEPIKTLIETRGQGALILSPLCTADAHPSGKLYKLLNGTLLDIPFITPLERETLLNAARALNEYVEPRKVVGLREIAHGNGFKPGEDFNARSDVFDQVCELLVDHGWHKFRNSGPGEQWSRPGVSGRTSATLFPNGTLNVFSTNAFPFEGNQAYSPFAICAFLKHDGDFAAAARALGQQGYGSKPKANPAIEITNTAQEKEKLALRFVRMSDVEAKAVDWLWNLYIALGALTIIEGQPGVGKSTLCCAVTAAITRGKGLPGMDKFPPGNVLVCSAEDSKAHVLRPRLDAAGADVSKVFALDDPLTLDASGRLGFEAAVIEYEPTFIVLDPFFAFTGGKVDIHRANEMRDITAWLTKIAEKYNCAVLAVRHLAKSRGMGQALNAGLGSIDLGAAARSVLLVGQDPDDGRKRAIVQIKNNLGPAAPAVGFTLENGMFYWTGESDITAARILSLVGNQEERSAIDEAMEFLRESLFEGDRETAEVIAEAKRVGISDKTLRNARERLKIRARREGLPGTKQKFYWSMPDRKEDDYDIIAAERAAIEQEELTA